MKLYKNSKGVWAGTQEKARSFCGKDYTMVDVPVDKAGLLQFLNLNQVGSYTSNDKELLTILLTKIRSIEMNQCMLYVIKTEY